MPIYRLLRTTSYGPEDVQILCSAYEEIIASLPSSNFVESLAEQVARKVLAIYQDGERRPAHIVVRVKRELMLPIH